MAEFFGVDGKWHPEGYFYGVDGEYHAPAVHLGVNGKYEPISSPWKIEGIVGDSKSSYSSPGSFFGVDGERHQSGYYYGVDGCYHHPDTHYDVTTGKYTDPPPPQKK